MSPGGESLTSFQARVEARLRRLIRDHEGQTAVVVCHGGVIGAASLTLMSQAMHRPRSFRLQPENTSITEWFLPGESGSEEPWVLVRYNDFAHLGVSGPAIA